MNNRCRPTGAATESLAKATTPSVPRRGEHSLVVGPTESYLFQSALADYEWLSHHGETDRLRPVTRLERDAIWLHRGVRVRFVLVREIDFRILKYTLGLSGLVEVIVVPE